ncbi:magnesium transporter [Candidatus Uhrbacteria bacterium CG_4_10_14_0_8_um_filter_58_22]|uniref:Magnesium transporter MgtE n=1 Tax=Candidatus Uhrbacteria bacterium CG_4_10_14_0_8_um_filter_58_22 TaxID=1975029 RepID=A0A2M7QA36_9BACT|nr:MAG: magnesium transporter [Parcubacteria group bacterium CG1_02_58_44]PIY62737.1 MAG: magnesium transporter [Candidatus Uhrbacteria bacterium CG_4_10_14_0_8_um_filter_58_22]
MEIKNFGKPLGPFWRHLRGALFRHESGLLSELLPEVGDEELAHAVDSLRVRDKLVILRALPVKRRVKVLLELSDWSVRTVLPRLSLEETWSVIMAAESDDAADIIQRLYGPVRERVIARLREDDPHDLLTLSVFAEQSAGGRMKTELLSFRDTLTVDEVRREIVGDPMARQKSNYIYVVSQSGELLGRLSAIRLLQADSKLKLPAIMDTTVIALPAGLDQEEAALAFDEAGAIELPVVNHRGRLLGVITADDIFEVMEEEYGEDVSRLAGMNENAHINDPMWLSASRRMPWLGVNLVTAMLAASVVGLFRGTIEQMVILAVFMPVIAGMGGNAAQQSLAVTIRSIAVGELRHLSLVRVVAKEVLVGAMNGFLAGFVAGLLASIWTGNWAIGAVVTIAMTLNLLMAGFVGVSVPLTMRALKVDPALASTVFVTATTDVFGFFVFLGLATLLLV